MVVVHDRTPESAASGGFLNVRRLELALEFPDGTRSPPFRYDVGDRKALDAVVIVAHFAEQGIRHVYLRSSVRPPAALRTSPPEHDGALWELPAGLIEENEDAAACASRELAEEAGFVTAPSDMSVLGPWTFPTPGMIGERHLFFSVEVNPHAREKPTEDGSALEQAALVVAVPLAEALSLCRSGGIRDSKTELALRRLAEVL